MIRYETPPGYRKGEHASIQGIPGVGVVDAPPYHISADLIGALNKTDLSVDHEWNLPFHETSVVLPCSRQCREGLPEFYYIAVIKGLFHVQAYDPDTPLVLSEMDIDPCNIARDVHRNHCDPGWSPECINPFSPDEELSRIIVEFAIKVSAVLSSSPELIDCGTFKKRAKMGPGGERVDLFTPRWIGRTYRLPVAPPQGGTHASPRLHWRRGHIRRVRCGAGRLDSRIVFVGPTLVGSEAAA